MSYFIHRLACEKSRFLAHVIKRKIFARNFLSRSDLASRRSHNRRPASSRVIPEAVYAEPFRRYRSFHFSPKRAILVLYVRISGRLVNDVFGTTFVITRRQGRFYSHYISLIKRHRSIRARTLNNKFERKQTHQTFYERLRPNEKKEEEEKKDEKKKYLAKENAAKKHEKLLTRQDE